MHNIKAVKLNKKKILNKNLAYPKKFKKNKF